MNAPTFRSDNVFFRPAADPTGNGQPTAELVVKKADGSISSSRCFLIEQGGQKLKLVTANGIDVAVWMVDANGRMLVEHG